MKLNFKVFKSGTIWWVIGGILLFIGFFYMASKGGWGGDSNSTGSTAVVQSGPSEAAQLQMAGLGAQTAIAQAQLASDAAKAQLDSDTQITLATIAAGLQNKEDQINYNATLAGMQNQKEIAGMNFEYSIESAKIASENALGLANYDYLKTKDALENQKDIAQMQADMVTTQLITQADILKQQMASNAQMFKDQLLASITQSGISMMPSLGEGGKRTTRINAIKDMIAKLQGQISG